MKENIIQKKSYDFALKIVGIYQNLVKNNKEFVLSKQLLRSGTSIGANIEEAIGAQSRKDFYSKLSIAYKEARETKYWVRILCDSDMLSTNEAGLLLNDLEEILKIIGKIQKTVKDGFNS